MNRMAGRALLEQLAAEQELARNPSFDLSYPHVPGKDLEGVPNANERDMREKLRRRLLLNPDGGQELPGFLKRADAGLEGFA